jgi:hypothetical protein
MTVDRSVRALLCGPLPEGFSRRVIRLEHGVEVGLEPEAFANALVIVERGSLELECRDGTSARFGRGSMIPIGLLPVDRLRSVGPGPVVLVAVSRATDEFLAGAGSHPDS